MGNYIIKKHKVADAAKNYLKTKMDHSWYQTIDGVRYERLLLDIAAEAPKPLTKDSAEKLWKSAMDGNQVTAVEKATLEHILRTNEFNSDASKFLNGKLAGAEEIE